MQVKSSQVKHQERPLYVYSDLVQTQIICGSETDLRREVVYNGSKSTFKPHNLQFIPIRKNKFDTLEIGISETDGTQAEFLIQTTKPWSCCVLGEIKPTLIIYKQV